MTSRAAAESARRVSRCVTALIAEQPFFGSLALRLPIRPDPSRETLASDGSEIRYDPAWVAETGADSVKTAIARVVLACALKHHTRRGDRDPARWQHASQLVTHGLLRDAGFILPPDAEAWDGISVEQAYDRLPGPESGEGAGDGGDPDPGGEAGNDNDAADTGDDGADAPSLPGNGDAPPSADPAGTGEVMDSPGGDATGCDSAEAPATVEQEQAWDEAMHQALNLARAQGKLPGAVAETVRSAHISRLDWRSLLRRFMTDAAKSDYTWSQPNRRFIDSGLYLPALHSEAAGTIAVMIDSSGSLPSDLLAAFWTEIRGIAGEIRPETLLLLQVDTEVREAAEHTAYDLPQEIAIRGRGGTDFRPGFEWIAERGIAPAVCLYFTDLECSHYPKAEPPYPVLWVNWGAPPGEWNREPWGERIDIAAG
ncbi:MAG: VWA-like domain-containing protein [Defluviicoccus sp.]|nr:VWA-like domain-containing protein [Defluviicoccus sp.]